MKILWIALIIFIVISFANASIYRRRKNEIKRAARYTGMSYCPAISKSGSCSKWCKDGEGKKLRDFQVIKSKKKLALLFYDKSSDEIFVSFRGTYNKDLSTALDNWSTNINTGRLVTIEKRRSKKIKIHSGFKSAHKKFLKKGLDKKIKKDDQITS